MKWSSEYVWAKIDKTIPGAKSFGYALPEALKATAVEMFINEQSTLAGNWDAYVVSECLKELKSAGYLSEGSICEDWK